MSKHCPRSLNIGMFFTPSMQDVWANEVLPSSVLTTNARAKRLLTRSPIVR